MFRYNFNSASAIFYYIIKTGYCAVFCFILDNPLYDSIVFECNDDKKVRCFILVFNP